MAGALVLQRRRCFDAEINGRHQQVVLDARTNGSARRRGVSDFSDTRGGVHRLDWSGNLGEDTSGVQPLAVTVGVGSLVGPYRLIQELGSGGMGAVFIGQHTILGKTRAIKITHPELASAPQLIQRFINEARAAASLGSEHIVKVEDCQQDARTGIWWISMEHLHGRSLGKYLAAQGQPLSLEKATLILAQIAVALDEAHASGVVHRDMKPENVFLIRHNGLEEFVKVLDFGIAKLRRDIAGDLTKTNAVIGTPMFMPPEQLRGRPVDNRADVYSVTVILYLMLSNGFYPFQNDDALALFHNLSAVDLYERQVHQSPVHIRRWNPTVPDSVVNVLESGLHRDRERRFRTVGDLAIAFGEAAGTMHIVRDHSNLLTPSAARRSIQVPVPDVPLEIDSPIPLQAFDKETVRLSPRERATQPLRQTAPQDDPKSTLSGAASTHDDAPMPVRTKHRRVLTLAALFATTVLATVATLVIVPLIAKRTRPATPANIDQEVTADDHTTPDSRLAIASAPTDAPLAVPVDALSAQIEDARAATGSDATVIVLRSDEPDARPLDAGVSTKPIVPDRSKSTRVSKTVPAAPGILNLKSDELSTIFIDGKESGTTPKTLSLPGGRHSLKLKHPATGVAKTQTIEIRSGEETTIFHKWNQ